MFFRLVRSSGIQNVPNTASVLAQMICVVLHHLALQPQSVLSEMKIVAATAKCPLVWCGVTLTTSPLMALWSTTRYELIVLNLTRIQRSRNFLIN